MFVWREPERRQMCFGAKMGTYRADTYRAQLKRLLHLAPTMKDRESRSMLLRLAEEYHEMALRSVEDGDELKSSSSDGSWLKH
jgi:hypothetical protein